MDSEDVTGDGFPKIVDDADADQLGKIDLGVDDA